MLRHIHPCLLDWLELIAPVMAVELPPAPGGDDHRVVAAQAGRIVEIEGHSIGLVHELVIRGINEVFPGVLAERFPPESSLQGVIEDFFGRPVETVVFGHTHFPWWNSRGHSLGESGSTALHKLAHKWAPLEF